MKTCRELKSCIQESYKHPKFSACKPPAKIIKQSKTLSGTRAGKKAKKNYIKHKSYTIICN